MIPDLVATVLESLLDVTQVRLVEGLPKSLLATLGEGRPIGSAG